MASASVPSHEISPIAAAQQAIERTRRQLFPFRFDRWLALGLVAFLDQCGRTAGGGGAGSKGNGGGGTWSLPESGWPADLGWLIGLGLVILAAILVVVVFVLWVNSRGVFMYADNIATGRADVIRPWHEHRRRANDYFLWNLGLGLLTLGGILVIALPGALLGMSLARDGFDLLRTLVVAFLSLLMLGVILVATLASTLLRDFVAPIQWRRGVSCREAVEVTLQLVWSQPAAFIVYVLLKIVYGLGVLLASTLVGCFTCCLGFLPVIRHTVLQPVFYFERAWSLELLAQLGEKPFAEAG